MFKTLSNVSHSRSHIVRSQATQNTPMVGHILQGAQLKRRDGSPAAPPSGTFGLYFGSAWCPDCTNGFIQHLKAWYDKCNATEAKFEIVYVSSDRSAEQLDSVLAGSHGNWLAIEYNDPAIARLKRHYQVCAGSELGALGMPSRKAGIPSLLVVTEKGDVVDFQGADTVRRESPAGALKEWGL